MITKNKRIDETEAIRQIIEEINAGDWDDLLRVYRAAIDPEAVLVEDPAGVFAIIRPPPSV